MRYGIQKYIRKNAQSTFNVTNRSAHQLQRVFQLSNHVSKYYPRDGGIHQVILIVLEFLIVFLNDEIFFIKQKENVFHQQKFGKWHFCNDEMVETSYGAMYTMNKTDDWR